jgi:hypothetical protein
LSIVSAKFPRKQVAAILEEEFYRDFHESRGRGADNLPETGAADVAIHGGRPKELGVVEDVKGLHAELEGLALSQREVLRDRHIEIA